jgi:hypothetical protein
MSRNVPLLRRAAITGISFLAAVGVMLGTSAQPASAAWANLTGWHTVCARDLSLYNAGQIGTLHQGDWFNIDHFADSGNHAWGFFGNKYGWVYNGWFC